MRQHVGVENIHDQAATICLEDLLPTNLDLLSISGLLPVIDLGILHRRRNLLLPKELFQLGMPS
jgi:hypothetical protein